ncbi:SLBB domain-containing protein [Rheinheimera sp.]|uniref:polysaccharide biosynthesis/export family protein n=1 Tax=Rheinheimera sp. TaxID=1869214 RepID=UPI003AF8EFB3
MLKKLLKIAVSGVLVLCLAAQAAVTPSPAMMAQFKNLPAAEQQKLAKQYGINLPAGMNATSSAKQLGANAEVLVPQEHTQINDSPFQQRSVGNGSVDPEQPQRFGMNLFTAQVSTFAPVDNAPVTDNYRLGPDDTLLVQLYGKVNDSYELVVSRDGTVNLADVGPLTVSGLSFSEASAIIKSKVSEAMLGVEAAISMGKLRTINIFVAGEAKTPGMFAVSAMTTVTQALYLAGGVSEIGSLRDIQIKRAGQTVGRFDLYDLLLRGDSSADTLLRHGDVIFISPVKGTVQALGEVKRPSIYEIKSGDNIDSLLAMAGGAAAGAYPQAVVLERYNSNNLRDLLNLDLTKAENRQLALRDGDTLRLAETSPRIENVVTVAGAVVRPGHYAWQQGLRISNLISSFWSDLHLTADLDYALVIRETSNVGDVKVLQFNLAKAINSPASADNLVLKARDIVLVFHHADQNYQRADLNAYLRKQIQRRLNLNQDMQWATTEDLAKKAFAQLVLSTERRREAVAQRGVSQYVAGQQIHNKTSSLDNTTLSSIAGDTEILNQQSVLQLAQRNAQVQVNQLTDTTVINDAVNEVVGAKALPEEMARVMRNLYYDKELLMLSASLTRTELLYPLIERLRMQARTGDSAMLVRVQGEVRVPGEYPLAENSDVSYLVKAAGGFTEAAYLGRAEITRAMSASAHENGIEVENIAVNLQEAFNGGQTFVLQSRDRLNVFPIPDWNIDQIVEVRGEVRFPGRYTIKRGERLSDVLARAGGLSGNAFADGAIYTRESVRERERLQLSKLTEQLRADIATKALSADKSLGGVSSSAQESLLMIEQIEKQEPVGRLVLDLEAVLAADPSADIQVEDGDLLYIPRADVTVSVVGEVQHASSHRFKEGLSLQDYLGLAGGLRKRADADRVYIIKADGSVQIPGSAGWFAVTQDKLQAGDTIVVPVDTEYKDSLSLWTAVTQIFYQSAVAVAAINSF